jgi:hypothetical protein
MRRVEKKKKKKGERRKEYVPKKSKKTKKQASPAPAGHMQPAKIENSPEIIQPCQNQ